MKFLLTLIAIVFFTLLFYYGNTNEIEVIYHSNRVVHIDGEAPQKLVKTNLNYEILDVPDLLVGKLHAFSDTMQTGQKYRIVICGFNIPEFGMKKNIISVQ